MRAPAIDASGKLRILLVDDEPTIRGVIGQVLRDDGHSTTEVSSGEDALLEFEKGSFPLVIADILMGGMSGLELLREIKAKRPDTLVVIMTSYASLDAATTALRGGAYDFLVKPIDDLIMISALVNRATETLRLQALNLLLEEQLGVYAGELERLNSKLKEVADRDWLTGLYNRRFLFSALDSELSRSIRHGRVFSMAMLDVDKFKSYNDAHGHLAGDQVLIELAEILREKGRTEHLCVRYGGEEFLVLMPETDSASAFQWAERTRQRIEEHPFKECDTQPGGAITVSVGIATYPTDGDEGRALIERADAALYHAKELGRNRVV